MATIRKKLRFVSCINRSTRSWSPAVPKLESLERIWRLISYSTAPQWHQARYLPCDLAETICPNVLRA